MIATAAEPAGMTPVSDRRGGISFRIVWFVFFGLLVLGMGFGFVIHRRYVGFERVAARHVPPDAALVVRWDVEKVSLFEPTRRFLLPVLDASPAPGTAPGETRRDRLLRAAGLEIGRDMRELLAVFGPAPGDWAVVLAGSFPEGDVVGPAHGVLRADGFQPAGPSRLSGPGGVTVGRAGDGAFVLASNAARFASVAAEHPLDPHVPRTGAAAAVVHPERGGLPAGARALLDPLGDVAEIHAHGEWGSPFRVLLTVRYRADPPADAPERLHRALAVLLGTDVLDRLEKRFGRVEAKPAPDRTFSVDVPLDGPTLDGLADRASRSIVSELALRPALD